MSCRAPLAFQTLVAYWARDLSEEETERVDEHVMGCADCARSSERIASVIVALAGVIPPVVDRATVDKLRAAGVRLEENTFLPGQRTTVPFPPELDLLIHRLTGLDLTGVERVHVTIRSERSGQLIAHLPGVPFDPEEGVLIACQHHFDELPADTVFEVRALPASGPERVAVYTIPHER